MLTAGFSRVGAATSSSKSIAWLGPLIVVMGAAAAFFETFQTDVDPFRFSYAVFFFALPLLNAILDTASWAVSQGLGREMLNREFHRWGMVGLALIDVVCAFAFLCGLAVLLGAGGEALNQFVSVELPVVNVDELIGQVSRHPFGSGL